MKATNPCLKCPRLHMDKSDCTVKCWDRIAYLSEIEGRPIPPRTDGKVGSMRCGDIATDTPPKADKWRSIVALGDTSQMTLRKSANVIGRKPNTVYKIMHYHNMPYRQQIRTGLLAKLREIDTAKMTSLEISGMVGSTPIIISTMCGRYGLPYVKRLGGRGKTT